MHTKKELIDAIAEHTDTSKVLVETIVDAYATIARQASARDGEIVLPSLGKLAVKKRPARQGRNPRTGKAITIAARKVPSFAAARHSRTLPRSSKSVNPHCEKNNEKNKV